MSFLPTDIPDCAVWLDAQDGATLTIVSGGIAQANDKSGNGADFTPINAGQRPEFTSAVERLNGRDTIANNWDNTLGGYALKTETGISITGNEITIFCVNAAGQANGRILTSLWDAAGLGDDITADGQTPGDGGMRWEEPGLRSFFNGTDWPTTLDESIQDRIVSHNRKGTYITNRVLSFDGSGMTTQTEDQAGLGTSNFNINAMTAGSAIDADHFFAGVWGEFVVYGRSLSPTEVAQVEQYLIDQWFPGVQPSDSLQVQWFSFTRGAAGVFEDTGLTSVPLVAHVGDHLTGGDATGAYPLVAVGRSQPFVFSATGPESTGDLRPLFPQPDPALATICLFGVGTVDPITQTPGFTVVAGTPGGGTPATPATDFAILATVTLHAADADCMSWTIVDSRVMIPYGIPRNMTATGSRPTTAAATDLATAITLVNQLRTIAIAEGLAN